MVCISGACTTEGGIELARVIQERYLPYDPDGRGREGYRLIMPLASMPPHDMPDVFDDKEPLLIADPSLDDDAGRA